MVASAAADCARHKYLALPRILPPKRLPTRQSKRRKFRSGAACCARFNLGGYYPTGMTLNYSAKVIM